MLVADKVQRILILLSKKMIKDCKIGRDRTYAYSAMFLHAFLETALWLSCLLQGRGLTEEELAPLNVC
jgi:hypothetical protein